MRIARPFAALVALGSVALFSASALAADLQVDAANSVFAVLTRKAGVAAGLAHDHLITAPGAAATLQFDPAQPEATRATLKLEVANLEFDAPGPRSRLAGRLSELGIGPKELPPVSASDRRKVREAGLGEDQLDAAASPALEAELLGLGKAAMANGAFAWTAKLRLTIRGKSVERPLATRFESSDGKVTAEAWGEFKFSDFGIEPYSAALGAVRNDDRFFVYVSLAATAN
jgi:polyisoprenoid-binding protein YceI